MHWQRCEPRQIYEEMSLLLRLNSFFFMTHYFGDASFDIQKVELVCLSICHQLSVFPNNAVRICPITLKIGMLYHMNNDFLSIDF